MATYSLSHLSDYVLMRELAEFAGNERCATAGLLARIAEVDARKLYLPAAYPSMFAYCVHELRLSEDSAFKRITAARTARQYPVIFEAVAEGQLHLTAVGLLAPYLRPENADELLKAVAHKTKPAIEQLIAERFPRPELLALVEAARAPSGRGQELAPERVGTHVPSGSEPVPEPVVTPACRSKVAPHASGRFAIHAMIGQSAHDDLRQAQALLGHQLPSGDIGAVLERALRLLVVDLEKSKFAATEQPRHKQRPTTSPRHVPAHVKRAVWQRDQGQCTFISDAGQRCPSRTLLEFDHIDEVARGGEATVDRMRLRCRAHNQYAAECTFGAEFMNNKRHEARQAAEARKADAGQRARVAAEQDRERDVIPWLRQLGFSVSEARDAAAHCAGIPDASLEERVRMALSYFHPRSRGRFG